MCNNAWRRLCNEWTFNALTEGFQEFCERAGLPTDDVCVRRIPDMQQVRKDCRQKFVWLEDSCETDIYLAFMPFGGYTKKALLELKDALKEYRTSGRSNHVYRDIIARKEA